MFHTINGCTNVRKVINNSNLPVTLPTVRDDSWVSINNNAFSLASITNGTAIRKSDSEGISTSDISGTVGENVTWKLAVDGTLTITGTGEMEAAPWGNYNKSVKKIIISEGITTTSSISDTKATMDSAGFIVRNKTTGTAVMEATKTGGKFLDLTSTGKSNLSGLLVQKVGSKICINGESGS